MSVWDPKQTLDQIGLGDDGRRSGSRADRVAQAIHEQVSLLMVEKVSDPRLAAVAITRVEVSPDLARAKIYYTVAAGGRAVARAAEGFQRAAGFFRSHLARTINLRFTPTLHFFYDTAAEKAAELDDIFRELAEERAKR